MAEETTKDYFLAQSVSAWESRLVSQDTRMQCQSTITP